jgi:hypothetical protein
MGAIALQSKKQDSRTSDLKRRAIESVFKSFIGQQYQVILGSDNVPSTLLIQSIAPPDNDGITIRTTINTEAGKIYANIVYDFVDNSFTMMRQGTGSKFKISGPNAERNGIEMEPRLAVAFSKISSIYRQMFNTEDDRPLVSKQDFKLMARQSNEEVVTEDDILESGKTPHLQHVVKPQDSEDKAKSNDYDKVVKLLSNDIFNHAAIVRQLTGEPWANGDEATNRSLFRKKLKKMNNDQGGEYSFSPETLSDIQKILMGVSSKITNSIGRQGK